ncbi:ribosomal protein S5 domain 2-like protein [Lentinus tigrinus ALCF2SS1-7]|uniref:Ribosomal RNA-processing protein 43 n=1 Tax=Lentinus tigrinus ALCF2SS1-6 TaxID=1328759 RepID=A0A5C2T714_9APHY|nr:ribosomal protein S5 domain 2-like protein [Lentinus tigrinus ALCF2SS1-6]RPD81393.1 ribosomal protein S5 domain 2-like protein [Lentinus tigrinus ALCF2SS1-7]
MAAAVSATPSGSNSAEQDALKALTFQRLHPRTYLERFVAENVRPDGRDFGEWRDISVNVGSISTADGSALVRLGSTTVVCGVKAEIAEPELDRPKEGFLVPNLDLPAICSPKFKPGPPTDEAQVLSDRLNEVLVSSGVVPTSSLCIEPGKAVWVLYVDATCINYDGNAFDATLLAMVAALKNTKLPKARYDEVRQKTVCSRKNREPLQIGRLPTSYSFGIFDGTHLLADPTSFEEPLLDTTVSVVVDENGGLTSVMQLGLGIVGGDDVLSKCIDASHDCWQKGRRDVYGAS